MRCMQHTHIDEKFIQDFSLKLCTQESCLPEDDIKMDLRQIVNEIWTGFVSLVSNDGLI
jgi:hypothetical protein